MVKYENDCVDCGQPCLGTACPYHSVPHYYCDDCGDETHTFYFDDEELCIHCIEKKLERVSE